MQQNNWMAVFIFQIRYSADAAPRVPTLKLSMYLTVRLSRGTTVPPDCKKACNIIEIIPLAQWSTLYFELTANKGIHRILQWPGFTGVDQELEQLQYQYCTMHNFWWISNNWHFWSSTDTVVLSMNFLWGPNQGVQGTAVHGKVQGQAIEEVRGLSPQKLELNVKSVYNF